MFITFLEQFVKLSQARAENNYVCKHVFERFLCLNLVKKVKKKRYCHRVLLADVEFESQ